MKTPIIQQIPTEPSAQLVVEHRKIHRKGRLSEQGQKKDKPQRGNPSNLNTSPILRHQVGELGNHCYLQKNYRNGAKTEAQRGWWCEKFWGAGEGGRQGRSGHRREAVDAGTGVVTGGGRGGALAPIVVSDWKP